mgnify:CR=1 FL=1
MKKAIKIKLKKQIKIQLIIKKKGDILNFTSIIALFLGIALIFVSQKFDGGSLSMLIQPAALCIVLGGSFCAVALNFNIQTLLNSLQSLSEVFKKTNDNSAKVISEIITIKTKSIIGKIGRAHV